MVRQKIFEQQNTFLCLMRLKLSKQMMWSKVNNCGFLHSFGS